MFLFLFGAPARLSGCQIDDVPRPQHLREAFLGQQIGSKAVAGASAIHLRIRNPPLSDQRTRELATQAEETRKPWLFLTLQAQDAADYASNSFPILSLNGQLLQPLLGGSSRTGPCGCSPKHPSWSGSSPAAEAAAGRRIRCPRSNSVHPRSLAQCGARSRTHAAGPTHEGSSESSGRACLAIPPTCQCSQPLLWS